MQLKRSEPMGHLVSLSLAVLVGALLGAAVHRLRWTPLLETTSIVVLASLVGSLVAAGVWLTLPPEETGVLAVTVGLVEALVPTMVVAGLGLPLHLGFAWVETLRPGVVHLRPAALGIIGAIIGVLGFSGGSPLISLFCGP
jgi:hypothetical protein